MFGKEKIMIVKIITSAAAVFTAIIVHETAHGWAAWKLGDDTARQAGRLTLNPAKHIDVFGTIVLPIVLFLSKVGFVFGWAKPVPVNYNNLKHRKRDVVLVASAGIAANLVLAGISAVMLKLALSVPSPSISGILAMFWLQMIFFNIVLAVFNLLPIPPLDGSKMLLGWSDNPAVQKFLNNERNGMVLIIFLAFILPILLQTFGIVFNPFASYLRNVSLTVVSWLI